MQELGALEKLSHLAVRLLWKAEIFLKKVSPSSCFKTLGRDSRLVKHGISQGGRPVRVPLNHLHLKSHY